MVREKITRLASLLAFALLFWSIGYAQAYESYVVGNLSKTRDALLDQRSHLASKMDEIKRKMNDLDKQLTIIEGYMRDTDRAINDIDAAIRRAS